MLSLTNGKFGGSAGSSPVTARLLSPEFLLRLGLDQHARVLDIGPKVRCRSCGVRGKAVVLIKWQKPAG